MSANFNVSAGVERIADRLANMSREMEQEIQRLIVTTTMLTQEAIVDKITDDIEPHSGMHRQNNPRPVVTDLVDTGVYRASWQVSFPAPLTGKVATNCEYALALEYGRNTGKGKTRGFFVARDTAIKMRRVFRKRLIDLLRKHTQ